MLPLLMFGLLSSAVAIKLLLLARRTRQLPELSISLGVLLIGALGLPLAVVSRGADMKGTETGFILFSVGLLLVCAGHEMTYLFCWNVFRRTSSWAKAAVLISSGLFLFSWCKLVSITHGIADPELALEAVLPYSLMMLGMNVLGASWSGAESFRYWGMQKKRLKLGLASPLVVERFLWWGTSNFATAILGLTLMGCTISGRSILTDPLSPILINITGSVLVVTWALSFFPPKSYVLWVERRAAAAA